MRLLDKSAGLDQGEDAPLIQQIKAAIQEFTSSYGFPPEELHVSRRLERALTRWAYSTNKVPQNVYDRMQGASLFNLPLIRMTKKSLKVEFYVAARRDERVYYAHVELEPKWAGEDGGDSKPILLES